MILNLNSEDPVLSALQLLPRWVTSGNSRELNCKLTSPLVGTIVTRAGMRDKLNATSNSNLYEAELIKSRVRTAINEHMYANIIKHKSLPSMNSS